MAWFRLTDEAQADFDSIGLYTLENWGESQAIAYLSSLDLCFHALASDHQKGRMRYDVQPDLWSQICSNHLIYFRRDAAGNVTVLRVLHERMDSDRYF